jgi:hypothetical protein
MFNADSAPASFVLPAPRSGRWRLALDTAQPSFESAHDTERDEDTPLDICCAVGSHASVVLVAGGAHA